MDIEYECTPPKKMRHQIQQFSTPDRKTTPKDSQTPKKRCIIEFKTPQKSKNEQMCFQTPKKNQNPQSRKMKKQQKLSPYTPIRNYNSPMQQLSSEKKISHFTLTRLQTDYEFHHFLGSGNFSSVGLYSSRLTKEYFAIKITEISLMSLNEVQALGTMSIFSERQNHIIRYFHSWMEQGQFYIVMEYCEDGLEKVYTQTRSQNKLIPEDKLKNYLKQALQGLMNMHQHNMVHLDIKPDNLLLKDQQIKISDLGLCRIARIKKWTDLDQGDSRYLAKEVLNYHQGIDLKKADIFSLGMSIFQGAILQDLPNNGQQWLNIRQNGIDFSQIPQMNHYSDDLKEILTHMIKPNWFERPSCEQILNHKYFNEQKSKRLSRFMTKSGANSRKKESSL